MELTFEGPITGGDLPACVVLRCPNESSYMLTLRDGDDPFSLIERLICDEHKTALEAGEAYRWDPDQYKILMGTDRTSDGRFVATNVSISNTQSDHDSALGAVTVLGFTNEEGDTLEVAVSEKTAETLGSWLRPADEGAAS